MFSKRTRIAWDFAKVSVRLADDTCATFLHLETVAVLPGQKVVAGTQIGTAGSSGHSSGTHLHHARVHCRSGMPVPSSFIEAVFLPAAWT